MDPQGTDGDYEFIELRGEPKSTLSGYWLVAIEGDLESNRGQVDNRIDLSSCNGTFCEFDERGLLLLVADSSAVAPPVGSAWRLTSELAGGKLENGTTSLWLLSGNAAIDMGADWDVDDDGQLEIPFGLEVKDAVAWTDGDAGDLPYAPAVVGPKPKAQAAWECDEPPGISSWRFAQLLGTAPSLSIDVEHCSPIGLTAFELTPGAPNHCQVVGGAGAGSAGSAGFGTVSNDAIAAAGSRSNAGAGTSAAAGGLRSSSFLLNASGGEALSAIGGSGNVTTVAGTSRSAGGGTTNSAILTGNAGSKSSDLSGACAGSGGASILVVEGRAASLSGSSGWWSPAVLGSGLVGAAGSVDHLSSSTAGVQTGPSEPQPELPSGCVCGIRSDGRLPVGPGAAWLAIAAVATLRRRFRRAPPHAAGRIPFQSR